MSSFFQVFSREDLSKVLNLRNGETKLGEKVHLCDSGDWKKEIHSNSPAFVLFGIPEDIGVRANGGVGGAHTAWIPALQSLLNIQSVPQFTGENLTILGQFDFSDWMEQAERMSPVEMRDLVAKIDKEVYPIVEFLVSNGKIPIIIGGGHNNAFPLLKGSSLALKQSVNCINLDAHSDFRVMEGRHSGNGFRYAKAANHLDKYAIIGLHENYNSESVVADLNADNTIYFSFFEDIFIRQKSDFTKATETAFMHTAGKPAGIELDLDCIQNVLSSAATPVGISAIQARQFLSDCARKSKPVYLHLAEGATVLRNGRQDSGTGKLIAYLLSDFIKGFH